MRLFTDRPQHLLAASRDEYLLSLVAEDNGGPEDVVVDCMFSPVVMIRVYKFPTCSLVCETDTLYNAGMSLFSFNSVSQAMMRASGMRQYSELRAEKSLSTSKDEYFMAAMEYVGSITDCDSPKLKEAAIEIGMKSNPTAIKAAAVKQGCSEEIAHEMWMRYGVHRHFENILGDGELEGQTLQKLKEFFFQLLYPL
jgi:hypothetical protein